MTIDFGQNDPRGEACLAPSNSSYGSDRILSGTTQANLRELPTWRLNGLTSLALTAASGHPLAGT